MQTYLAGDYPSAASNPKLKFRRAVASILNQQHEETELVIVADGCEITKELYEAEWKNNDKVKFAFVDKTPEQTMHNNGRYYRGVPREVGRAIATGHIIAYLDADDYALPTHASSLVQLWAMNLSKNKNRDFCLNTAWYDNYSVKEKWSKRSEFENIINEGGPQKVAKLESDWIVSTMNHQTLYSFNTNLISHRSSVPSRWIDTTNQPEDFSFVNTYINNCGTDNLFRICQPIYVRCHAYDGKNGNKHFWDF